MAEIAGSVSMRSSPWTEGVRGIRSQNICTVQEPLLQLKSDKIKGIYQFLYLRRLGIVKMQIWLYAYGQIISSGIYWFSFSNSAFTCVSVIPSGFSHVVTKTATRNIGLSVYQGKDRPNGKRLLSFTLTITEFPGLPLTRPV